MTISRRKFLKSILAGSVVSAIPASVLASVGCKPKLIPAVLEKGKWHHIAITRSNGVLKNFLDFEQVSGFTEEILKVPSIDSGDSIVRFGNCVEINVDSENLDFDLDNDWTIECNIMLEKESSFADDLRMTSIDRYQNEKDWERYRAIAREGENNISLNSLYKGKLRIGS